MSLMRFLLSLFIFVCALAAAGGAGAEHSAHSALSTAVTGRVLACWIVGHLLRLISPSRGNPT